MALGAVALRPVTLGAIAPALGAIALRMAAGMPYNAWCDTLLKLFQFKTQVSQSEFTSLLVRR